MHILWHQVVFGGDETILMRVDDFPRTDMNLKDFKMFDSIMKRFDIPYLLGVTPNLCLNPLNPNSTEFHKLTKAEIEIIRNLKDVELAMHGVTHQTRDYGYLRLLLGHYSEFEGMDERATSTKLERGFKLFREYGLKRPRIFIPPFNRFDEENLNVFRKHFKFVMGGPETKKAIKKRDRGELIISDGFYYGHSYDIFLEPDDFESDGCCCIALHWGWETDNDFLSLKKLLVEIEGNVARWGKLE